MDQRGLASLGDDQVHVAQGELAVGVLLRDVMEDEHRPIGGGLVLSTSQDAATKQAEARNEANADKRDAEYKVAIEKCDALAGQAKTDCGASAKARFGKN